MFKCTREGLLTLRVRMRTQAVRGTYSQQRPGSTNPQSKHAHFVFPYRCAAPLRPTLSSRTSWATAAPAA